MLCKNKITTSSLRCLRQSIFMFSVTGAGTASRPGVPIGEKPLGRVWDKVPTSQNDTDQTVAAVVDDAFGRFFHLFACVRRHTAQLVLQSFVDKLVE